MKISLKWAASLVIIICLSAPYSLWAAPVLDAHFTPAEFNLTYVVGDFESENFSFAQTFTVGTSGQLTHIEVPLFLIASTGSDQLFLDLLTTSSGVPTFTSLAQSSIPHTDVPGVETWMTFDLSSEGLLVEPGDVHAIQLSLQGGGRVGWSARTTEPLYSDGQVFQSTGADWLDLSADLRFKTFVEPGSQVPIPAAVWLFGAGIAGLLGIRRKMKL